MELLMVLCKPFACKPAILCQLMCSREVEELLTVNLTRSAETAVSGDTVDANKDNV